MKKVAESELKLLVGGLLTLHYGTCTAGSSLLLSDGGGTSNNKPCLERKPFTSSDISVLTLRSFASRELRYLSNFSH